MQDIIDSTHGRRHRWIRHAGALALVLGALLATGCGGDDTGGFDPDAIGDASDATDTSDAVTPGELDTGGVDDATGDVGSDSADPEDTHDVEVAEDTTVGPSTLIMTLSPAATTGVAIGGGLTLRLEPALPIGMTGGGLQLRLAPAAASPAQAHAELP